LVSIVLARLLQPQEYGLIALISIFIALANVFIQTGLNTALIQKKDVDEKDYSTVFYASLGVAGFLYVILFFASPFIASFYDQDLLVPVLRALSITLFFGAVNSIQIAVISRNMQFKKLFYSNFGAIIISADMHFEELNLTAMAEDIAAELKQSQPERDVEFIIEPNVKAYGDSHLLRIVLENLLRNAWKFTSNTRVPL